MFFDSLFGAFSNDIAIDLGTATTLVYVKGKGVILMEPSVVAMHKYSRTILAVGEEAKRMVGRTPGAIVATRPLRDGVITDFEATEEMLRYFITKVHNRKKFVRPRVVIAVTSGITEAEKRALKESASQAGAREIYPIEEPMAAAIGAGLPVEEPGGNMVVDIGGGTTEVAVISLAGIVKCKMIKVAGDEMDQAIIRHLKNHHNLLIGERTAEEVKIKLGSAYLEGEEEEMEVKGRDLVTGLPKYIRITSEEVREALQEPVEIIVRTVKEVLEETPPELSADLVDRGIVLTGGGAKLRGLDKKLSEETGLPTRVAEDPDKCVAVGAGKCLDEIKLLRKIVSLSVEV
ncbi:rod shape-determining protein [Candidatus Calescamantes bacterium]|nr:rod shape-determining protein [Candidatus Calescamantes bacterium]